LGSFICRRWGKALAVDQEVLEGDQFEVPVERIDSKEALSKMLEGPSGVPMRHLEGPRKRRVKELDAVDAERGRTNVPDRDLTLGAVGKYQMIWTQSSNGLCCRIGDCKTGDQQDHR
jgi:hypothetical protein